MGTSTAQGLGVSYWNKCSRRCKWAARGIRNKALPFPAPLLGSPMSTQSQRRFVIKEEAVDDRRMRFLSTLPVVIASGLISKTSPIRFICTALARSIGDSASLLARASASATRSAALSLAKPLSDFCVAQPSLSTGMGERSIGAAWHPPSAQAPSIRRVTPLSQPSPPVPWPRCFTPRAAF